MSPGKVNEVADANRIESNCSKRVRCSGESVAKRPLKSEELAAQGLVEFELDTRAIKSSSLYRKSFRIGDVFILLYPTTRSTVGTSPSKGRLMTDPGAAAYAVKYFRNAKTMTPVTETYSQIGNVHRAIRRWARN